jgi:8-oxo-dGTP diphosphatase
MIPVGIALVHRDGRFLVRQRPERPGSPMPGYWEFPGGKCEPAETPAQAASRECAEEAGIAIEVCSLRRVIAYHYPHGHVELHYFDCVCRDNGAEPNPEAGFCWVAASELPALTFPPANEPILVELARGLSKR